MKSQCAQSGMKGRVGGFQNQGVCLQAFPSFPSPTPSFLFLLSPHFRAGKTPKPPFFAFSSLLASRKRLLRRLRYQRQKSPRLHDTLNFKNRFQFFTPQKKTKLQQKTFTAHLYLSLFMLVIIKCESRILNKVRNSSLLTKCKFLS